MLIIGRTTISVLKNALKPDAAPDPKIEFGRKSIFAG